MIIHRKCQDYIPKELKRWPQWVCWRFKHNPKTKTLDKVPIDPKTGRVADVTDPATWGSFEEACAYASEHYLDGVGFVFTPDDPFCGIDLDDCIDPETGEARLGVDDVIDTLGSYAEISPSGTGIKSIVKATKSGDRCSTKSTLWGGGFEIYDQNRFFAMTGSVYRDTPIREAQEAVDALYARFFPESGAAVQEREAVPSGGFPDGDGKLLERARNCKKTGRRFRSLFDHGDSILQGERSEADLALCGMLAYWTGCDPEAIKRLFRQSALASGKYAEKERHGEAYLDLTVNKAIRSCTRIYDPSYGDRLKDSVRDVVAQHRSRLSEVHMRETKRRLVNYVLATAQMVGKLKGDGVDFNLNQEEAAEIIGTSQRTVSTLLKEIVQEDGWLARISKGRPGRNSFYRLLAVEALASTTYVHTPHPVGLRSRTNNPEPVSSEGQVITIPTSASGEEVYTPEVTIEATDLVKNLPPIGEDGIYWHGSLCACWLCSEDAPEFIPAPEREATPIAGVA